MFKIAVKSHFDSAHLLRGYEGKCSNLHGHRWEAQVVISGEKTNETGMLIDFSLVKKILKEILNRLDHRNICDIPPFDKINPTAENLARYIYWTFREELDRCPGAEKCRIEEATVWESPECRAQYTHDGPDEDLLLT